MIILKIQQSLPEDALGAVHSADYQQDASLLALRVKTDGVISLSMNFDAPIYLLETALAGRHASAVKNSTSR